MKKTYFALFALLMMIGTSVFADESKPNFVLILADDMGWTGPTCYGSDLHRTPFIDTLAKEGMRFTNAYSACCVCSPTRASIYTGQYPARLHLTDWIPGKDSSNVKMMIPNWVHTVSPSVPTIPKELAKLGYVSAIFGKWHLGSEPAELGFQESDDGRRLRSTSDPKNVNAITQLSIDFISKNRAKPFFCVLAHHAVHSPIQFNPQVEKTYEERAALASNHKDPEYAAMVDALDEGVGKLMKAIHEMDLDKNTVIIFFSDNGGLEKFTNNIPLREGKGTQYEGGIRVPLIVRWPGHIAANSLNATRVCSIDFLPTLVALAHGPKTTAVVDGIDISPLLTGSAPIQREALFWHYPHYHAGKPGGSIIQGDMKLINFFEENTYELYDLAHDQGESKNLASQRPEIVADLRKKLEAWRTSVGAQMMTPNPNYDPDSKKRSDKEEKSKKSKGDNETDG